YNTAKRVVDELGKGQEMLRVASEGPQATVNGAQSFVILIPDVDIVVVGARMVGAGGLHGDDNAEIIVPQNGNALDVTPAAGNRLVSQITDPSTAEDTVLDLTLAGLNGNLVRAGQPIVGFYTDDAGSGLLVHMQVSYILADDVRTF
ncbi:hypothetical protein LCGC14_3056880, partial [marine sediment metagenome]